MKKDQIINLWKNVGWHTLEDYHNHLRLDPVHIELSELSPDKINPKTFWSAADEHFGTDPICNQTIHGRLLDIQEADYQNYLITVYTGMAGQTSGIASLLKRTLGRIDIAEIGCGYSSAKSLYLEIENKYYGSTTYTGFDVIKRASSSVEIEGEDGTFSEEQIKKYNEEFNLFFSSNTFQHLSRTQIESYLRAIYNMLPYGGYFNMMYVDDLKTYHYGQIINIIPKDELINLVKAIGYDIVGSTSFQIPNSLTPYTLVLKK